MGVYIKGVGMPKSCYECKLDLRTGICPAFCEWLENNPYSIKSDSKLPGCPLVELPSKHGRLIDADEMKELWKGCTFEGDITCLLDPRPTVLEAEGD